MQAHNLLKGMLESQLSSTKKLIAIQPLLAKKQSVHLQFVEVVTALLSLSGAGIENKLVSFLDVFREAVQVRDGDEDQ